VVLAHAIGRLVGWYKTDAAGVGKELNDNFPLTLRVAPNGTNPMLPALAKFASTCHCLFDDASVSSESYQKQLAAEIADISAHRGTISKYLHSDADYIGYSHSNANIDNAYWWRDEAGTLKCGLIDFGGYSCASVTALLATGLFSAEAETMEKHGDTLFQAFIDGVASMGGPTYHLDELRLRMTLELAFTTTNIAGVCPIVYKYIKNAEWASIKDRHDERVAGRDMNAFLARSNAMYVVNTVTRYKRQGAYQTVKDFLRTLDTRQVTPVLPLGPGF